MAVSIPFAVNVQADGGSNYTDSQGLVWLASKAYALGSFGYTVVQSGYDSGTGVAHTNDDTLYKTCIYGAVVNYLVDVPNGTYEVYLCFNTFEIITIGARIFKVEIGNNGGTLTLYDTIDVAQRCYDYYGSSTAQTAFDGLRADTARLPYIVTITNGIMQLKFTATANLAVICGIYIKEYITGKKSIKTNNFSVGGNSRVNFGGIL